jgi:phenylacetic acid degradation operon negative regulatory protein
MNLPTLRVCEPDVEVRRWIRRELASAPPRAPSLIITIWGDAIAPHGGAVMLAGLIDLLAPFGINERLVRTSVFRLAREGWLKAKPVGRESLYRLTTDGAVASSRPTAASTRRLPIRGTKSGSS